MLYSEPRNLDDLFFVAMDRIIPLLKFCNGKAINVGAYTKRISGTESIDLPQWDADEEDMPYLDGSISTIYAFHFLEHVREPVRVLHEFQRILAPGGVVNICVPYYKSNMAYQDLDHKHFFTEDTWKTLFSNPYYDKNKIEWKFTVGMNVIIGVAERNLCLLTQLIKE